MEGSVALLDIAKEANETYPDASVQREKERTAESIATDTLSQLLKALWSPEVAIVADEIRNKMNRKVKAEAFDERRKKHLHRLRQIVRFGRT